MDRLQAGELCLVLVDQVPEALAHIAAKVEKSQQSG
jgi:cyanophycin synthetase